MVEGDIEVVPADVEMGEEGPVTETAALVEIDLPFAEEEGAPLPVRVTFIDYLKSPIVELLVGQGEEQTLLSAHQALLVESPWFAQACAPFDDGSFVSTFDFV